MQKTLFIVCLATVMCFDEAVAQQWCDPTGTNNCDKCNIVCTGNDVYIINNSAGHTKMIPLRDTHHWDILPSPAWAAGVLSTYDCKKLNINGVSWERVP